MRWAVTIGGEVGRADGRVALETGDEAILVENPVGRITGVTGRPVDGWVGGEAIVSGSWQARLAKMSKTRM